MIEKENELISSFYESLWLCFIGAIMFFVLVVVMLIFRNKLLKRFNATTISKIVLYVIAFFIFVCGICFSVIAFKYSKDLKYVKQRGFCTITGTVVGYSRAVSAGDIASTIIYYGPIIREIDSGNTIRLNVQNTELGKSYTFIYLPNSHLAVIVSELP